MSGIITDPSSYSSSDIFTQTCGANCYQNTLSLYSYLTSYLSANYSTTIIPKSGSSVCTVSVLVSLTSLLGLSTGGELSVLLTLLLSWTDSQIAWTPATYGGVNYLYLSATDIWTPELTVLNPYSGGTTSITFTDKAYVSYDGTVQVLTTVELDTTCNLDLSSFPFDFQTCTIYLNNYLYSTSDFVFYTYNKNLSTGDYSNNSQWTRSWTSTEVTSESIIFNVEGDEYVTFSVLKIQIGLLRNAYYYIANLLAPTLIMILLVACVFILPTDCGEKIGYSSTLMLSFYVLQQLISGLIPSTDNLPNLSVAMIFGFCLSAISCIASVVSILMRTLKGDLELQTQLTIISTFGPLLGRSEEGIVKFLRLEIEKHAEEAQQEEMNPVIVANKKAEHEGSQVQTKARAQNEPAVHSESLLDYMKILAESEEKKKRRKKKDDALDISWILIDFMFNLVLLACYIALSIVYVCVYMF